MSAKDIEKYICLSPVVKDILNQSANSLNLSARAYHKTIKLARTIADLDNSNEISVKHLADALVYRSKN